MAGIPFIDLTLDDVPYHHDTAHTTTSPDIPQVRTSLIDAPQINHPSQGMGHPAHSEAGNQDQLHHGVMNGAKHSSLTLKNSFLISADSKVFFQILGHCWQFFGDEAGLGYLLLSGQGAPYLGMVNLGSINEASPRLWNVW